MLNILASSFMTATRTGQVRVHDVPPKTTARRKRRWNAPSRWIDPNHL
ncbi:hypothetical protein ACXYMO_15510 [Arenibacterium sp. CAU 1754]